MLAHVVLIAQKELVDAARDVRSLVSSLLYCLMGPGVVFMVSLTMDKAPTATERSVLIGMMSVFTLVSAFASGMNVGMDVLAGERERRSLLPLLMNAVARRDIILGKWIAIGGFSLLGLMVTLGGFFVAFAGKGVLAPGSIVDSMLMLGFGLVPLALLASALELCLSTVSRSMKEAHTSLSMLVFLPMVIGMFVVFYPNVGRAWSHFLPIIGQQWQLERWVRGDNITLPQALLLGVATALFTSCALSIAVNLLKRDDVVYGD
jgi:sodium transport system permease protein